MISIDFIDFSTILSIFVGFLTSFCVFSTISQQVFTLFADVTSLKGCDVRGGAEYSWGVMNINEGVA